MPYPSLGFFNSNNPLPATGDPNYMWKSINLIYSNQTCVYMLTTTKLTAELAN